MRNSLFVLMVLTLVSLTACSVGSITASPQNPTITIDADTLTVTRGAGDPTSNNILAGASSLKVGEFNFAAQNSSYTVINLAILVPNNAATSVTNVTVSYKDMNGATQTQSQALAVTAGNAFATATFTGLTLYVPTNDSSNMDVYVGTPTVASGAVSGTGIDVSLDTGATPGNFKAIDANGNAITKINGGVTIAASGTFYVRKSIPTFSVPSGQGNTLAPSSPLYRFSISADPAGAIEWAKTILALSTTNVTLSDVYIADEATGGRVLDGNAVVNGNTITIDLTKNTSLAQYQQIGAGATKTYALYGTVNGFAPGSSLTIGLLSDIVHVDNGSAQEVSGNVVWSDRSATNHTAQGTAATDWTNGYLLKNFTNSTVNYGSP